MFSNLNNLLVRLFCLVLLSGTSSIAFSGIHRAPVILKAKDLPDIARYPIRAYRLYRSSYSGRAKSIPFQIDEVNHLGDYVLDHGKNNNKLSSNGYFDNLDELSFMGDDVGPAIRPKTWPDKKKPNLIFEVKLKGPEGKKQGAVYVGMFFSMGPPLNPDKYVVFDVNNDTIKTSRYEYAFDRKNYLVVKHIDMLKENQERERIIDSSTFFMKADLKYFLTVKANHRSVNSQLEAYKTGPVRSIVRVNFIYSFLNIDFEVGMYTEVSFFSNSVILPAVIQNPIDGVKRLNSGSGFYYGFALKESPKEYQFETNMKPAIEEKRGILDFFALDKPTDKLFWASLIGKNSMMYVELRPSASMLSKKNVPRVFLDNLASREMKQRDNNDILDLGQSPVNMALYFDLTKFSEGEHLMAFQLFFENKKDKAIIDSFKSLSQWTVTTDRI